MAGLVNSWKLVVFQSWSQSTEKVLPVTLSHKFTSQIIRTETSVFNVPARWYRAGYMRQLVSVIPQDEVVNKIVPLNSRKIFGLPLLASNYQILFTPVDYLPSGLKLRIWEYTGPQEPQLLQQLLLA